MKRSLVVVCAVLVLAALAAGWSQYRSSALGIELSYPTHWKSKAQGDSVIFNSKEPQGEFSVRIHQAMPLSIWVETRRKSETLPDGSSRVEKVGDTRLAGLAAKRIVLFGFDRYIVEEAVVSKGKLYVLQYDSQNPNDPQFAQHWAVYTKMRASFKPL